MSRNASTTPATLVQRLGVRRVVALGVAAAAVVAIAVTLNVAGQDPAAAPALAAPTCGWDLTQPDGVKANADYLNSTAQWLANYGLDNGSPPKPTSPFWLGDCPLPPGPPPGPPVGEANPAQ